MSNTFYRTLFFLLLLFGVSQVFAQQTYEDAIKKWQEELNQEFGDPEESPLPKKELKKFKGLTFFAIDPSYQVKAKLIRTPNASPMTIPTTTDRLPVYTQYGILNFELEGTSYQLPIYQNFQLGEEYEDYLFAPFTDETNGFESYGGGRYLDLRIPESDTIILDFNKAYNPYCAYSAEYSCPIPPRENDLALKIRAGVMAWNK